MRFQRMTLPAVLLGILMACSEPSAESPGTEASSTPERHGIAWFEGSIEEAFAYAKAENKPLFFYWGAVWCPPCHYLKTKIFTREEFIAQTRSMIPVYLDGDTERAQLYGERFGTLGYPTVILFNPDGQEITRMPSSLPVDRYAEVLEQAMSRLRPIKEVFADVTAAGAASADPIDLNLLAFYAWDQDHEIQLAKDDRFDTFRGFYRDTPAELVAERSRFLSFYLTSAIQRARGENGKPVDAAEREKLREAVQQLLTDREQRAINLDLLLYWSRESVELLYPDGAREGRDDLIATWKDAARALESDETLSVDDRLSALLPRLWLARLEASEKPNGKPALPEALRDEVRQRIAWASETVTDQGELQAVMNTMAGLLAEANLSDEAEALLSSRLEDTAAPYYYMSWIAGLKSEKGENEEALEWYRKAYDSAEGRYTRFRWGSIYLRQRLKLAPEDVETLSKESLAILDELLTFDDAFAGGNHSRLAQLDSAFDRWNEDGRRDELIASLRERVHAACDRFPEDDVDGEDSQRSRCRSFLSSDEETAAG